jgi:GTP cyclohydrolase I
MLQELTAKDDFVFTVFDNENDVDEMIIIQDIPFYTLCAHHLVPFFGKAHVAYIPSDCIAGLSKFARAIRYMARGLWVQEQLTDAIAIYLEDHLRPRGLAVVLGAEHFCMSMRGAQVPGTRTTTSAMRGVFLDSSKGARSEFLNLIREVR